MYYGNIIKADIANGTGIRVSLFVSGCTNHCKGCFQPQTWDFEYGKLYTESIEEFILGELSNQRELVKLIRRVKNELPDRNIWIYTGFTYDKDLVHGGCRYIECTDEILDNTDILVDGRFIETQRDLMLNFRGSRNQRIIDMKQTRKEGNIILSSLN